MRTQRRHFLRQSAAALFAPGGLAFGSDARAQSFPNRPVKFVVPFTPGGAADPAARVVGRRLSEILGWEVVIENKPGGGGNLGLALQDLPICHFEWIARIEEDEIFASFRELWVLRRTRTDRGFGPELQLITQ